MMELGLLGITTQLPEHSHLSLECLFLLGTYLGLEQLKCGKCVLKSAACERSGLSHLLLHMVWSVSGGGGQLVGVMVS